MTKKQEIRFIDHSNRIVIAMLSLTGMMLDGGQIADLVLEAAIVLWLWLPEWRSVEHALLRHLHTGRSKLRPSAS